MDKIPAYARGLRSQQFSVATEVEDWLRELYALVQKSALYGSIGAIVRQWVAFSVCVWNRGRDCHPQYVGPLLRIHPRADV